MHRPPTDNVTGHLAQQLVPTLVHLRSSCLSAHAGEPLALTAQVARQPAGAAEPATGLVVFRRGRHALGAVALDGRGRAVLSPLLLPPGIHALTAAYGGDARHAGCASAPVPQAVSFPAAPTAVRVAAPTASAGGHVLEAELLDLSTGRVAEEAEGSVTFFAAAAAVVTVALVAGRARVAVGALPAGMVEATYSGDADHAPAHGTSPLRLPSGAPTALREDRFGRVPTHPTPG